MLLIRAYLVGFDTSEVRRLGVCVGGICATASPPAPQIGIPDLDLPCIGGQDQSIELRRPRPNCYFLSG